MKLIRHFMACFVLLCAINLYGVDYKPAIRDFLAELQSTRKSMGPFRLQRISISGNTYKVYVGVSFSSFPFRPEMVDSIENHIKRIISPTYADYAVEVYADDKNIRSLIPNYYLEDKDATKMGGSNANPKAFVRNNSQPYQISKGLQNRNIALWHSHGWFYDQKTDRWIWQRGRLFNSVEDKLSLSFVIPYLLPMLENAGAYVFLPRERDMQVNEVIVDNDISSPGSEYIENGNGISFKTGGNAGFGYKRKYYTDGQNPFAEGTYRSVKTTKAENASIEWVPNIPADGNYAVYVSYKSVEHSVEDAKYTIFHKGGSTDFTVNQKMGGGTWIYLGTFYFPKGTSSRVKLSNKSSFDGVITADAVRFGGGMGNIGRRPAGYEEYVTARKKKPDESHKLISCYAKDSYETSGRARFWEGSRYWLQWAGAPEKVYSHTCRLNDYTDDYASRGVWVNWLNQGSVNSPDSVGLGIPIDLALAFHTDAGCWKDTVVGTLSIYSTLQDAKTDIRKYPNGKSREMSRDLADLVQTSVCEDIMRSINKDWQRRWMWDKGYSETRRPDVPAVILELLSHQNYADMQYGLDPRFKFLVSRAVYKGILRFLSTQYGTPYVVQPLPVKSFALQFSGEDSIKLSWRPNIDTLESTAAATHYVLYTRKDGGWDNGVCIYDTTVTLPLKRDKMISYKIRAANDGGVSMDSETLSVKRVSSEKGVVMVINGFDRICAPEGFATDEYAGFPEWKDHGVPDKWDLQYVGSQYEYSRSKKWISDDMPGWGASHSNYETMYIAGNTFDFPLIHGIALANAGYSFVSCSRLGLEDGLINLNAYDYADLILGEQKSTFYGKANNRCEYKTFSLNLQRILTEYTSQGGALFVSGAHVVSDLWNSISNNNDREFARRVLKVELAESGASQTGKVADTYAPNCNFKGEYRFSTERNDSIYEVESADALQPIRRQSYAIMRYTDNNMCAATAYKGYYRLIVCGFPFETILGDNARDEFMWQVMRFLSDD